MSNYQANIIIKNPATPTGPSANGSAPGIWRMNEVAYWIKQGVWPNANILPDPYFPYVSTLLSTTSLGNANNNLFVDSSGAFNPISRNGNTTQGSVTPYSANWSNYFDGSGDFLSIADNAAFDFGTGNFTMECWVYLNAYNGSFASQIFGAHTFGSSADYIFNINTTGKLCFQIGSGAPIVVSTGSVSLNTWTHVAIVRSGTSFTPYINGVNTGGGATSSSSVDAGRALTVGSDLTGNAGASLNGYISNLRIVKGTAVYTGNFTVPTSALTAISGTSLLTCQSNRFRDASSNSFSISRSGDVRVTDFAPLAPAYPGITYNQSDITNWSGYFDGSGDYLESASNSAFSILSGGDFTVEAWVYFNSISDNGGYGAAVMGRTAGAGDGWIFRCKPTAIEFVYPGLSANSTSFTFATGQWYHIVAQRNGSTLYYYVNGTRYTPTYSDRTTDASAQAMFIGRSGNDSGGTYAYINGYISNARIVKGTAVYSGATITVPTTNLTAISGTSLLTLQNAAFTDNSTNNFVITPNGNTTVTGNSPFNTVGYWSNYFDGSGDYLSVADNAALQFGTGNFTVECWFNSNVTTGTTHSTIIGKWGSGFSTTGDWALRSRFSNSNQAAVTLRYASGWYDITTGVSINDGGWHHLAFVRENSTTLKLYVDGVLRATQTISASDIVGSSATLGIGGPVASASGEGAITGYVSNARLVKGTAVYTSAFTPSTTPLTAVSGTSLLTCQNGRFIDNSTNAFTVTPNGDTKVQSFDPFYTSTIASNGGSMYFDNTGDYLAIPASASLAFGTGNFTLEAWVYGAGAWSTDPIFESRSSGSSSTGYAFLVNSSGYLNVYTAGGFVGNSSTTLNVGSWNHVALVRSGTGTNQTTYYINGVASGTITLAGNFTDANTNETKIGGSTSAGENWNGYISDARISRFAVYTGAFTPPTTPLTPSGNTALLVNGMNAGIYDATAISEFETFGNPQVSTVQSKFGGSSIYFDGSDDVLAAPSSPDLDFGTGDFTIEMWVRPSNFSGSSGRNGLIMRRRTDTVGTGAWAVYLNGSGNLLFQDVESGTVIFTSSGALTTNTWQHIAVTRSGSTVRGFINGVLDGSGTSTRSFTNTWYLILGMYDTSGGSWPSGSRNSFYTGWMDDVRITRGIARYTANFTPPTQAFPTY